MFIHVSFSKVLQWMGNTISYLLNWENQIFFADHVTNVMTEPHHEITEFLSMRKQRRRSAVQ